MPETLMVAAPAPLTSLTEDEILFRDNVRQFAEDKIRPLAHEMDEKAMFDHGLLDQFFQLGLMGIEIPEQYGGAGGKFFEAILAVEEFSRGRRFGWSDCRRAEYAGRECDSALGYRGSEETLPAEDGCRYCGRLRA